MLATALAAALLAATPAGPDLHAAPPAGLESVTLGGGVRAFEPGPFRAGELVGSGVGLLAGDALVLGLAYGTYQLFVSGALSPSVGNFRHAAYGLAAAALLLPPLGAVIGGGVGRAGPTRGAYWKAFLLSMVGHAAALMVGYFAAPNYWALLPVQLATMSPATSFGLHWGPRARGMDAEARRAPRPAPPRAVEAAPVAFRGAPICPDPGA
jgi:hypothetical protein